MHENLSSTLSVRANYNEYTNEKEGNDHWQCIASGKRFNSFFVLYAKFRGNIRNDLFLPTEVDFYLQTFEGDLTVGLTLTNGSTISLTLAYHVLLKEFVYILPVELEVLNNNIFVKQNKLKINASSNYECLSEEAKAKVLLLKNGIPEKGKIVVDMTFSDMTKIEVVNRGIKQPAFVSTNPDSPIINGDKFIREGSQLFERHYKMHNPPEYKSVIENPDLNPDCDIEETIKEAIDMQWTSPITYKPNQGLVYGLGCHPYICKIVF